MIEIKIQVSEVDYEDALDVLYPILMEHIKQNPKIAENRLAAAIIPKIQSTGAGAIKLLLKALPQETRDELAVACLNKFKDDIPGMLANEAKKRNIGLKIDDVSVSQY